MSDPRSGRGRPGAGGRNFTLLQFVLFVGAGLIGVAALLAAGLAFGLALAGAGCLAVLVLAVWMVVANLIGGERPPHGGEARDLVAFRRVIA